MLVKEKEILSINDNVTIRLKTGYKLIFIDRVYCVK